jgi:pilus assembly protein CpaF
VLEYISSKYATLIIGGGTEEVKAQVKRYIAKYVQDYRISVAGLTQPQLVDALYTEMAEFSFLTKYIFGAGIEEIDVNGWNDVEVQYSSGVTRKLDEHFDKSGACCQRGAPHAPCVRHGAGQCQPRNPGASLKKHSHCRAENPLVDEDVGVAASIRIVNPQSMKKEDFIRAGPPPSDAGFPGGMPAVWDLRLRGGRHQLREDHLAGWLLTTIPDKTSVSLP